MLSLPLNRRTQAHTLTNPISPAEPGLSFYIPPLWLTRPSSPPTAIINTPDRSAPKWHHCTFLPPPGPIVCLQSCLPCHFPTNEWHCYSWRPPDDCFPWSVLSAGSGRAWLLYPPQLFIPAVVFITFTDKAALSENHKRCLYCDRKDKTITCWFDQIALVNWRQQFIPVNVFSTSSSLHC